MFLDKTIFSMFKIDSHKILFMWSTHYPYVAILLSYIFNTILDKLNYILYSVYQYIIMICNYDKYKPGHDLFFFNLK